MMRDIAFQQRPRLPSSSSLVMQFTLLVTLCVLLVETRITDLDHTRFEQHARRYILLRSIATYGGSTCSSPMAAQYHYQPAHTTTNERPPCSPDPQCKSNRFFLHYLETISRLVGIPSIQPGRKSDQVCVVALPNQQVSAFTCCRGVKTPGRAPPSVPLPSPRLRKGIKKWVASSIWVVEHAA